MLTPPLPPTARRNGTSSGARGSKTRRRREERPRTNHDERASDSKSDVSRSPSPSYSPPPPRSSSRRGFVGRSFIGRVAGDLVSMPWDKVVAALISGLIIVVGATRLFIMADHISSVNLEVERLRSELDGKVHHIHSLVANWDAKVEMTVKASEDRILKQLRQEIELMTGRLQIETNERHSIDKRVSVVEIKLQLQNVHSSSGSSSGACDARIAADPAPAVLAAYERTAAQANEMYSALTTELETIRKRVDSIVSFNGRSQAFANERLPPPASAYHMTPDGSDPNSMPVASGFSNQQPDLTDAHVEATVLPDTPPQVSPPVSPSPVPTDSFPAHAEGGHSHGGESSSGKGPRSSGHGSQPSHAASDPAEDYLNAGSVNQILNDASEMGGSSSSEL